ncbi:MAG: hypothetical protein AAGA85_03495 [Bacteroidota bacterium]
MRFSLLTLLMVCLCGAVSAQSAYDKLLGGKKKANVTFYADEARTQPITKLEKGQTEFWAVAPLNKKHFKFPLGKFAGYAEIDRVEVKAEVANLRNGASTKDVQVYWDQPQIDGTFSELANGAGEVMVKFKIDEDVNFMNRIDDLVEAGNKSYQLDLYVGDDDEPIGYGALDWDFSDGGESYKSAALASRADYTFGLDDGVVDPEFKAKVIADIERRFKIKVYQSAHGERVPYTRDLTFYRRNQIGMTFKDLEDGKCYTGGISAFEVGSQPTGPFIYENDGTKTTGDEIPCDRVDK